jgi:hypothetical protein
VFTASTGTIDVGNSTVEFVVGSILTLSEGAILTAWAIPGDEDDPEPITLTAGPEDVDDDVVITNTASSAPVTLIAGVLTLPAEESAQATLEVKGAGTIVVGGAVDSVTFTDALFTAGGDDSSGDTVLTGAGGAVEIGLANSSDDGGTILLAAGGTIVTTGEGYVLIGTGLQIGGTADTTITAIDGDTLEAGVIFAATDAAATITANKDGSGDTGDGIDIGGELQLLAIDGNESIYTFTATSASTAPVVISGTDIYVPADGGNTGAIFALTEYSDIVLGDGTITLGGVASNIESGNGKLSAAGSGKMGVFTDGTSGNVKFTSAGNFATAINTTAEEVIISTDNTDGVLTLATIE